MDHAELSPFYIGMVGVVFLVLCIFAFRVSPEDIAACVESTGWSEDRCQVELTR